MKVLLQFGTPFSFTHGGAQVQIEQTKAALQAVGVEVDYLRWWDEHQTCDILHCFERCVPHYIRFAQSKGIKVVIAPLLTGQGSRPPHMLFLQRIVTTLGQKFLPAMVRSPFGWESFRIANGCVALTAWEAHLMSYMFGAQPKNVHVVPNGVESVFFEAPAEPRDRWMVCTATITERKRVLELARAAVAAGTPLWIIGKPYSESDPYARAFLDLAKQHPEVIRYEGPVGDRRQLARIYRQARGFVLLSAMESLSLSALEAAACECPLLLSDLPWARTVFQEHALYCPLTSTERAASMLRKFYDAAPGLKPPPKPLTWVEVGHRFKAVYETVLNTSR